MFSMHSSTTVLKRKILTDTPKVGLLFCSNHTKDGLFSTKSMGTGSTTSVTIELHNEKPAKGVTSLAMSIVARGRKSIALVVPTSSSSSSWATCNSFPESSGEQQDFAFGREERVLTNGSAWIIFDVEHHKQICYSSNTYGEWRSALTSR